MMTPILLFDAPHLSDWGLSSVARLWRSNTTHSPNAVALLSSFISKWSSWGPRLSIMVGLQLFPSLWPDVNSLAYKLCLNGTSKAPSTLPFVTVGWQMPPFRCFSQTHPPLPSAVSKNQGVGGRPGVCSVCVCVCVCVFACVCGGGGVVSSRSHGQGFLVAGLGRPWYIFLWLLKSLLPALSGGTPTWNVALTFTISLVWFDWPMCSLTHTRTHTNGWHI